MLDDLPLPAEVAAMLAPALQRLGGMLSVFDTQDRLRWANRAYLDMLDLPDGIGMTWSELMRSCHQRQAGAVIEAPDFETWLASTASRRGQQAYRQFEVDLHDGRWILLTQTVDANGWILELGLDVSDLGRDFRALRIERDLALRASQIDPLTGIGNRAFVLARLQEALAGPQESLPVVVLIDLDHFKRVNDWLGHAAGDQVLRHFAQGLQGGLRRADACGRIGGEEFMLLLGDVEPDLAEDIVNRVLNRVRAARPLPERPGFGYTASAGLVRAHAGERVEDVMARADLALYQAKGHGRDRCVRAD
jgi:diguanylate cyclase